MVEEGNGSWVWVIAADLSTVVCVFVFPVPWGIRVPVLLVAFITAVVVVREARLKRIRRERIRRDINSRR